MPSDRFETGEKKVSFLDNCLRIDAGFETKDSATGPKRRVERKGGDEKTFGANNGKLAFVTEGGLMYVTTDTTGKIAELESMGYKNTRLGVPLSNNEVPANQGDYEKWRSIVEQGK